MESVIWRKPVTVNNKKYLITGEIVAKNVAGDDVFLAKIILNYKKGVFLSVRVFDSYFGDKEEVTQWLNLMKPRYTEQFVKEVL